MSNLQFSSLLPNELSIPALKLRLTAELLKRTSENKLKTYSPYTKQLEFHERGPHLTSEELARRFEAWMRSGAPQIVFAIGDADGHTKGLRARADEQLALSRLTLPHRLARLLLVEQLYRALSIVRGEPYHRA